jgi:drug/metabolite transporter (DMT)-like permease
VGGGEEPPGGPREAQPLREPGKALPAVVARRLAGDTEAHDEVDVNEERSGHERRTAILVALFVTLLWSTSWVLIKVGLRGIPPLTFAGLRYALATLVLLPFFLRSRGPADLRRLPPRRWGQLILLGVVFYALTQGSQFVALAHLPAVTVNLLLSLTSPLVALLGIPLLSERPFLLQWAGLALAVAGVVVYFGPAAVPGGVGIGLLAAGIGVLANAVSSLFGRAVNRRGDLSPLTVTTVSMGVGAGILLVVGLSAQGLPRLGWGEWGIVAWLALVNTALAFTLWNRALRVLSAMESSLINTAMMVEIPLLAILFLGERLGPAELAGLSIAAAGIVLVQLRPGPGG